MVGIKALRSSAMSEGGGPRVQAVAKPNGDVIGDFDPLAHTELDKGVCEGVNRPGFTATFGSITEQWRVTSAHSLSPRMTR